MCLRSWDGEAKKVSDLFRIYAFLTGLIHVRVKSCIVRNILKDLLLRLCFSFRSGI